MKRFFSARYFLSVFLLLAFSASSFAQLYRTKKAGLYTDPNVWEYNNGNAFVAATAAPKSTNSIEVRHALVLNYNVYVAAGTTFTIFAPGTLTVNPVNSITVAGAANFGDQPVTFKSDATGTGRFGTLTGTIKGATNIIAERFIPLGKRSYRHLAAGLNPSGDIFSNWQNGGVYAAGIGTHITGAKGTTGATDATTGLDMTASGAASMFSFAPGASAYGAVLNTHAPLRGLQGYRIFIRGDRRASLTTSNNNGSGTPNINMNSATTLVTKGSLITGTVTYSTSGAFANSRLDASLQLGPNKGNFNLIANPYLSPLNFNHLTMIDIVPTFWVWMPNIGNRGAYVSYTNLGDGSGISNGAAEISEYIQSGQAFFVQNGVDLTSTAFSGNPVLRIKEANKGTQSSAAFREANESLAKINIGLYTKSNLSNNGTMQDAATAIFRSDFSTAISHEDAAKFTNPDENIALVNDGTTLGVEGRPAISANDTVNIRLSQLYAANSYALKLDAKDFETGVTAFVEDRFTNTQYPVDMKGTTIIPFSFSTDSASFYDRFRIVLQKQPVKMVTTDAKLSSIAGLSVIKSKAVNVYPNPVQGSKFNLQMSGTQTGNYAIMVYNKSGQQVLGKTLNISAGTSSSAIELPASISSGNYTVVVMSGKTQVSTTSVLVNNN